jgi:hypothetical protein
MHVVDAKNQYNMATSGTFYLDAPSLSTATVVYSNAALTTVAANGFYSDGSIVREQVSGVLLPSVTCPSCSIPCGPTISVNSSQGVYYLNTNLGSPTGAVIVRFNTTSVPDGIKAVYNSVVYNGLSSPSFGWRQGTAGLTTYLGSLSDACSSGIVVGSPYTLSEFQYNGTTFAPLGTLETVSIASGQMQLTASAPGNCVMVIPKTAASPNILDLTLIGPCVSTVFSISVSCPAALPSFASSTVNVDSTAACADAIDQTYYVAYVNGAAGVLGLYDLVFSDANGQFKLAAGYYKTTAAGTNEWFQVDANGVIIAFGDCLYNQFTIYFDVTTNPNTYGWASSVLACAGTGTPLTVYITGSATDLFNAVVTQGKALYTNVGLTTLLNGNNTWYKTVSAPASGQSLLVDGVGATSSWGGPC